MPPAPKTPRTPGAPLPDAGSDGADDLAEFEGGGQLPAADPVQAQLAELKAEVTRLKRKGQADPAKPNIREPEMSEDEAIASLADSVARGIRPRPILTPSGWMTHSEMARGPGSLGNAKA
jgi:hypothetical protein